MRVNIKPLSVNKAWQGRRFKTKEYKDYEKDVLTALKDYFIPEGMVELNLKFGVSSSLFDIDNGVKPFIDILQKRYNWNDKFIKRLDVTKVQVKKGEEFIDFEFEPYGTKEIELLDAKRTYLCTGFTQQHFDEITKQINKIKNEQ